jgi:hypothetical protein
MGQISQIRSSINEAFEIIRKGQQSLKKMIEENETQKLEKQKNLEEIDKNLPRLLADFALGRIQKSEVVNIKKCRAKLLEDIHDIPLLIDGLRAEERRNAHKADPIAGRERVLNVYEAKKAEIQSNLGGRRCRHIEQWSQELLEMAQNPALDCIEDAREFLENLRAKVKD